MNGYYWAAIVSGWSDVIDAIEKYENRFGIRPKYLISDYVLFNDIDEYDGIEIVHVFVGDKKVFVGSDYLPSWWSSSRDTDSLVGVGRTGNGIE